MKRFMLAVAIAILATGGTPARAGLHPAFTCDLRVTMPEFPGADDATIDATQSQCQGQAGAIPVGSTTFAYDDVAGCAAGFATGTLSLHGEASPFTYRRAGSAVKIDLLHGDQHYTGMLTLVFETPSTPAAIAAACAVAPDAAAVHLVGAFALS